jgi:hypothetical protein
MDRISEVELVVDSNGHGNERNVLSSGISLHVAR